MLLFESSISTEVLYLVFFPLLSPLRMDPPRKLYSVKIILLVLSTCKHLKEPVDAVRSRVYDSRTASRKRRISGFPDVLYTINESALVKN